jgi:RHS Repeat
MVRPATSSGAPSRSVSALNTLACYDSVGNLVSVTAPKAGLSSISCPGTTSTPFTTLYSYDAARHLSATCLARYFLATLLQVLTALRGAGA